MASRENAMQCDVAWVVLQDRRLRYRGVAFVSGSRSTADCCCCVFAPACHPEVSLTWVQGAASRACITLGWSSAGLGHPVSRRQL